MGTSDNSLASKIRERVCQFLADGSVVAAIKYYREVTLTPLLESKQFVEAFQADNRLSDVNKRLEPFLKFLEERDFGGAAASLCAEQYSPREAIQNTIHIAKVLDVDVSALELPATIGMSLWESTQAQTIVNERALELVEQRMVRNLARSGTSQEEAEKLIGQVNQEFANGLSVSPKPVDVSFDGCDPELARVVRLLMGPVPLARDRTAQSTDSVTASSKQPGMVSVDDRRILLIRRLGRLASLGYAFIAIAGIALLGTSYLSISDLAPFSMSDGLPVTEQETKIDEWTDQNLPKTLPWFISSVSGEFFPLQFEPGLPLAYAGEDWTWDKKTIFINEVAETILAKFNRCHEVLLVLYSIALFLAILHWFNLDILSAILMVFLGVLGVPFVMMQAVRMEFDNPLWLGPLLIPGMIALIASVVDLACFAPRTNRRRELRAFWFGAFAFIVGGVFLGWAIAEGNHLKNGAGLSVFGGAWLMLFHGWKYWRCKD